MQVVRPILMATCRTNERGQNQSRRPCKCHQCLHIRFVFATALGGANRKNGISRGFSVQSRELADLRYLFFDLVRQSETKLLELQVLFPVLNPAREIRVPWKA